MKLAKSNFVIPNIFYKGVERTIKKGAEFKRYARGAFRNTWAPLVKPYTDDSYKKSENDFFFVLRLLFRKKF